MADLDDESTPVSVSAVDLAELVSESPASKTKWAETITRCASAIVVLRVSLVRAFDGQIPSFAHATGFVVDAKRGIILTNRHVGAFCGGRVSAVVPGPRPYMFQQRARGVCVLWWTVTTGPIMAEAVFQNKEEIPVIPIYRYVGRVCGLLAPQTRRMRVHVPLSVIPSTILASLRTTRLR